MLRRHEISVADGLERQLTRPLFVTKLQLWIAVTGTFDKLFDTQGPKWQLLLLLWLALLVLAFNFQTLAGYWRWDDTIILMHVLEHDLTDTFFSASVYQEFSRTNLMPWLIASYNFDLALFGLNPLAFYLHQLLMLALAGWSVYRLLLLYTDRGFAVYGAMLFLLGAPVAIMSQQLMTRHYIEGLILCLWSLIFFIQYQRGGGRPLVIASVACYALSVMAKEVFVPLVVLLPFLIPQDMKTRLLGTLPFIAVAVLYAMWRLYMLDALLGGYTDNTIYFDPAFLPEVVSSFAAIPQLLTGSWWIPAVAAYLLVFGLYVRSRRRIPLFGLLCMAVILLPLVPLVRTPGITSPDRYLFLVWCGLSISLACMACHLYAKIDARHATYLRPALLTALLLLMLASASQAISAFRSTQSIALQYDVQGRFVQDNTSDIAFVPSATLNASFWYVTSLRRLQQSDLRRQSSPIPVPDDYLLNPAMDRLFVYDPACSCMVDDSDSLPQRRASVQENSRPQAPLSFEFLYQQGFVTWQAGPYEDGSYQLISEQVGRVDIPPRWESGATIDPGSEFILKYTAPSGWTTYSGRLVAEPEVKIDWSRP